MMKYIFCIIALLIQPVFSWYVYHKQDKKKAALKMPMLYYSVAYMVVQLYVFFKFCSKFPERYSIYSYLIQAAILLGFVIFEMILWGSNKYIEEVDNKEKQSIQDYKELIKDYAFELNRKPEPDTLAFQIKKGYKAKEVQVKMEDRLAGTSIYTGIGSSIQYMLKVLITIIFFN